MKTRLQRILFLLVLTLTSLVPLHAEEVEVDGLYYMLGGDTATLIGYDVEHSREHVVIPEEITYMGDSYIVTSIGGEGFL